MTSRIKNYEKILKKYGISLSKEELLEVAHSIDQLANCLLNFERKSHKRECIYKDKKSISKNQYPSGTMKFLRMEDILTIFSST